MSRASFAIAVPALVVVLGALLGVDVIGLAFQSEGCRFERDAAGLWAQVWELMLMQAIVLLLAGLIVAVLVRVLASRARELARAGGASPAMAPRTRSIGAAALSMFLLVTASALLFTMSCRGGAPALKAAAKVAQTFMPLAVVAFLILVVIAYVRGLRRD
jgi:hypothetical protein